MDEELMQDDSYLSLSKLDYAYVRKLINDHCGIVIEEDRNYLLKTRLQRIALLHGFPDTASLVLSLRLKPDSKLILEICQSVTTNETFFFRDSFVFDLIGGQLLPALAERHRGDRRIRLWSAASSTGQEPYSLAITVREKCPMLLQWDFSILATDISQHVLDIGRKGFYKEHEMARGMPDTYRCVYFTQRGNEWVIKDSLKKIITFSYLNFKDTFSFKDRFDIVLLRNVLIYLDMATKAHFIENLQKVLNPYGYLILGTTEAIPQQFTSFHRIEPVKAACYQFIPEP